MKNGRQPEDPSNQALARRLALIAAAGHPLGPPFLCFANGPCVSLLETARRMGRAVENRGLGKNRSGVEPSNRAQAQIGAVFAFMGGPMRKMHCVSEKCAKISFRRTPPA